MSFVEQLGNKCEMVWKSYRTEIENKEPCTVHLTDEDWKLFSSMERFHQLSHTKY